jgi:hypothetical protein
LDGYHGTGVFLAQSQPQWGSEELRIFLAWLDPNPERAATAYTLLQKRLRYFFEGWRDAAARAEELADLSIDRAIRKINEDRSVTSRVPASYVLSIARFVLMESRKVPRSFPLMVDPPDPRGEANTRTEERTDCLMLCLSRLPKDEYDLIKKYHLYDGEDRMRARREATAAAGKSPGAIRVRVCRICKDLEHCIADCLDRNSV